MYSNKNGPSHVALTAERPGGSSQVQCSQASSLKLRYRFSSNHARAGSSEKPGDRLGIMQRSMLTSTNVYHQAVSRSSISSLLAALAPAEKVESASHADTFLGFLS